jgi:catechol 2,3-dioxygenase-like lactoylglutathione lyase family enzyme
MDWKLEVVVVPVTDVDRAKRFYNEQLGFTVDTDVQVGGMRVVQLTPQGSACSVTIGPMIIDKPLEAAPALQLSVRDIEAAHAELTARGVPVGPVQHFVDGAPVEGPGGDYNSFIFFSDPDGNNWAVQQSPLLRS